MGVARMSRGWVSLRRLGRGGWKNTTQSASDGPERTTGTSAIVHSMGRVNTSICL